MKLSNKITVLSNKNINVKINYKFEETYTTWTSYWSKQYEVFNWKQLASTWNEFIARFPSFLVISRLQASILHFAFETKSDRNIYNFAGWTREISSDRLYTISVGSNLFGNAVVFTSLTLDLWRDGDTIKWQWQGTFKGGATHLRKNSYW